MRWQKLLKKRKEFKVGKFYWVPDHQNKQLPNEVYFFVRDERIPWKEHIRKHLPKELRELVKFNNKKDSTVFVSILEFTLRKKEDGHEVIYMEWRREQSLPKYWHNRHKSYVFEISETYFRDAMHHFNIPFSTSLSKLSPKKITINYE